MYVVCKFTQVHASTLSKGIYGNLPLCSVPIVEPLAFFPPWRPTDAIPHKDTHTPPPRSLSITKTDGLMGSFPHTTKQQQNQASTYKNPPTPRSLSPHACMHTCQQRHFCATAIKHATILSPLYSRHHVVAPPWVLSSLIAD